MTWTTDEAAAEGPACRGDGDGWVTCGQGHHHWGRNGAAGLLLHHRDASGDVAVVLQHRVSWSHHGGTWGLPGGARDSDESPVDAALREAEEEGDVDADAVRVAGVWRDDHGAWSYTTVLAAAEERLPVGAVGGESADVRWVPVDEVESYALHPGFAGTWPALRPALVRLTLVVDAANVVGSRPDGWWRDRAGAARRLRDDLVRVGHAGVPGETLPDALGLPPMTTWLPDVRLVVEGRARGVGSAPGVDVVDATGEGDDSIVDTVRAQVARRPGEPVLVVTADRGLRARVLAAGAAVTGPGWLHDLRDATRGTDG